MQITINIPDDLPTAIVQQQISEFEEKLNRLTLNEKEQQAIMQLIEKRASLPTIDQRTPDEMLDYDENPTGLWGD